MRAELADGTVLEFPDGTDPAVVQATVKKLIAQQSGSGQPQQGLDPQQAPITNRYDNQNTTSSIDSINQTILDNPVLSTIGEYSAGIGRGAVDMANTFAIEPINAALQMSGSDLRITNPNDLKIIQEMTTGNLMEPGLVKETVRKAGEFTGPAVGMGAALRGATQGLQAVPAASKTLAENVATQLGRSTALQDLTAGAAAGAGSQVGGEVAANVAGEDARKTGEMLGGIVFPVAGSAITQLGGSLATQSTKKLLNEAAPTVDGLKQAARQVYRQIDDLGTTINSNRIDRLSNELQSVARKEGFNKRIHPKVNAALQEFAAVEGKPQTVSEIDTLRRVMRSAANSTEPDEARLGARLISKIDDTLDNLTRNDLMSNSPKEVGPLYRDARQLWTRAKKGEMLAEAFNKAQNQASGFENGIRVQLRSILNSPKKSRGFSDDEIAAMREVVRGTNLQNIAKAIGRLGFSEGQATNMLMGSLGVAGGAAVGGPAGAVAVPLIGQLSRNLAQRITRAGANTVDRLVRAGNNANEIARLYRSITPRNKRSAQELSELLLRPGLSIKQLNFRTTGIPRNEAKLLNDAAFIVNAVNSNKENQ